MHKNLTNSTGIEVAPNKSLFCNAIRSDDAMPRHPLALAVISALSGFSSYAFADPNRDHAEALDRIVITAHPLKPSESEIAQPAVVLDRKALERALQSSIGETLRDQPGINASYFGPGASRPILRGLDAGRVRVMGNGLDSLDVSTVSVDHAVTIEPFLAEQIEVLKGPASLLYGSGAIGGVVNVVDGRIAESPRAQSIAARGELRFNGNSGGGSGMARIDTQTGPWAFSADALGRDVFDYADANGDRVVNSGIETRSGAAALSHVAERHYVGASVQRFESLYGIPRGVDSGELEEEAIDIDMGQTRFEAKAGVRAPTAAIELIEFSAAVNRYSHVEIADGEIGTRFNNDASEARAQLVHAPLAGWRGALGVQLGQREFEAIGEEAFVPPAETKDSGLFWVGNRDFGPWRSEIGARIGRQSTDLDDGSADRSDTLSALSATLSYGLSAATRVSVALDHAERAPSAEELFANGPHEATGAFEIGDPDLNEERARQIELALHHHADNLHATLSIYRNQIDNFIFQADTGEEEDDLPVREWAQTDATFQGFEAELRYTLPINALGRWQVRGFADRVDVDEDLPRISPWRLGAGLNLDAANWQVGANLTHSGRQNDIAEFESETAGYNWLSMNAAFQLNESVALFVNAQNLLDDEGFVHTSLLKDRAPLPGFGLDVGVRIEL
jgi:iron complex outermembrane recepter protein